MAASPIPGLSFGLSPSSNAAAETGLKSFGSHGGGMTGAVNMGAGASDTWVTGLVRDLAIGVGVALAAKYIWGAPQMSIKFALYCAEIAADILADLPERDLVCELMQRDDTRALIVTEAEKLLGYAVFGSDDDGILTVYAARAISGLMARAAMVGMFGAAQIMGAPLRVHTERVAAMARMMGAGSFASAFDSDGIPMGVFGGV